MNDFANTMAAYVKDSSDTGMRVGVITRFTSGAATVRISGSDVLVQASRLDSYQPFLGDTVVVMRQGANWIILGASASMPDDNQVLNPSFELDGAVSPNLAVSNWTRYKDPSGTLTSSPSTTYGSRCTLAPDGRFSLSIQVDTSSQPPISNSYDIYSSDPVPVNEGEVWALNAYTVASVSNSTNGLVISTSLSIEGYPDSTTIYPTPGTYIGSSGSNDTPFGCPWVRKQVFSTDLNTGDVNGVRIPAGSGVKFIRALLYTQVIYQGMSPVTGTMLVYWDRVVLKRIG